jgi:hypothetical protein
VREPERQRHQRGPCPVALLPRPPKHKEVFQLQGLASPATAAQAETFVPSIASATGDRGRARAAPSSGETVNLGLGTLIPGQSVTITFDVTIDSPFPVGPTSLCNQGTVSMKELRQRGADARIVFVEGV